jgi:hypothetical protein
VLFINLMEIRLLMDSLVVREVFAREICFRLYYAIGQGCYGLLFYWFLQWMECVPFMILHLLCANDMLIFCSLDCEQFLYLKCDVGLLLDIGNRGCDRDGESFTEEEVVAALH